MDQEGIAVGSGLERYNLGLNINAKTSDISRVGGNVSLSKTRQATALAESAYFASPVLAPYLFRPWPMSFDFVACQLWRSGELVPEVGRW